MVGAKASRRIFVLLAILILVASALPLAGCGGPGEQTAVPRDDQVVRYGKGYRFESNGWIYVHIEGEPRERGFQHGRLLARELADIQKMLKHTTLDDTGRDYDYFVDAAETLFTRNRVDEFLEEVKGIAEGAQSAGTEITWQEVLAWNGNTELTRYWYPGVLSGDYPGPADKAHCSAFVATGSYTKEGKVVMAHNTWWRFLEGQYFNVVFDIKPSAGHRILMQGLPGCIASMSDYFLTDAGIMGTETTIFGFNGYDPSGTAEFYRMRHAMQYANDLDEWVGYMLGNNSGAYANGWLLADARTGEIMRFELGLKYHSVERTSDGCYIGFNGVYDPRIRNEECAGQPTFYDTRTLVGARKVRLARLMEENRGKIDIEAGKQILSDHYDVYLDEPDNPCSRTVCGHSELDPFEYWQVWKPYYPEGAVDGKVTDSDAAREMSFVARWGNSCGKPFDAEEFLREHPQWDRFSGYLKNRPTEPWAKFRAGALD